MSKISGIYDAFQARIAVILPAHARLSNPYDIVENPESYLKKGVGLALGPARKAGKLFAGCKQMLYRDFVVSITREVIAREIDGARKAETEKQILEDLYLLIQDFEKTPSVNELGTAQYESDTGIVTVIKDGDALMLVSATFSVLYVETL